MVRFFLVAAMALASLQAVGQGTLQSDVDAPSAEASAKTQRLAGPSAEEKGPVGAVSFGYIYVAAETSPGGPWNWHLHGFYGIPQYNIKPWMALFADFTQSYNLSRGAHETVQNKLGGFLFTAKAKAKVSPFGFADAGYARDSRNGSVTESPEFAVGGGMTYKLSKHVSVLLIPGEYVRTYASPSTLNNFTARFGLVLPLYK